MSLTISTVNTIEKKISKASKFQYISSGQSDEIIEALTQISVRSGMAVYIWIANLGLVNIRSRQTPLPVTRSVLEALKYANKNHYFAVYVFPSYSDKDMSKLKAILPTSKTYLKVNENTRFLFLIKEESEFNFLVKNGDKIELENKHINKYKLRCSKWVNSNS